MNFVNETWQFIHKTSNNHNNKKPSVCGRNILRFSIFNIIKIAFLTVFLFKFILPQKPTWEIRKFAKYHHHSRNNPFTEYFPTRIHLTTESLIFVMKIMARSLHYANIYMHKENVERKLRTSIKNLQNRFSFE